MNKSVIAQHHNSFGAAALQAAICLLITVLLSVSCGPSLVRAAESDSSNAPAAPEAVTATAGYKSVTLTWKAVPRAAGYRIYESLISGGEGAAPIASGLADTKFTVTDLKNDETYYFTITAVRNGIESQPSGENSASPFALPPVITVQPSLNGGKVITGISAPVTVTATDIGGSGVLTYTWGANGPREVTFSPNGTTSSNNSVATFHRAGHYTVWVTVTDSDGLSTTGSVPGL